MTGPAGSIADTMRGVEQVLIDFDGPFCSVFAGLPAATVSQLMLQRLSESGHEVGEKWKEESDPLALLRLVSDESPALVTDVEAILADLEFEAVRHARPNADINAVLDACVGTGRSAIVVSNNAGPAIEGYLAQHRLTGRVDRVVGRVPGEPESMKPSPRLLVDALGPRGASAAVFIGDAVRDVEAGHAAGVPTIGYANKEGKAARLAAAGAVAVVTSLLDIAEALADRGLTSPDIDP